MRYRTTAAMPRTARARAMRRRCHHSTWWFSASSCGLEPGHPSRIERMTRRITQKGRNGYPQFRMSSHFWSAQSLMRSTTLPTALLSACSRRQIGAGAGDGVPWGYEPPRHGQDIGYRSLVHATAVFCHRRATRTATALTVTIIRPGLMPQGGDRRPRGDARATRNVTVDGHRIPPWLMSPDGRVFVGGDSQSPLGLTPRGDGCRPLYAARGQPATPRVMIMCPPLWSSPGWGYACLSLSSRFSEFRGSPEDSGRPHAFA